jgi:hypothetical protein
MSRSIDPIPWQETAEELYEQYRQERDVGQRKRLQVLWLVRRGLREDAACGKRRRRGKPGLASEHWPAGSTGTGRAG